MLILLISILVILINKIIYAKYIFQNEFYIADLNIDRTKPKIELLNITNTNKGYENYANKNHIITINFKIVEENLKSVFCDKEHIKIKIDGVYSDFDGIEINNLKENMYELKLKNIESSGKLNVEFIEGVAVDKGGLKSDKVEFDTNIIIDNIVPNGNFLENKMFDGKVSGVINLSEKIRNIEGWSFSEDMLKLDKEFTNNISYNLPIEDYAGNKSFVEVNITQASFINLVFASHNSNVGWTYGHGNYDIAGSKAVSINPVLKTEAIAFNVSGNIDTDFLQAKAFVHTYWGEGSLAKCHTSGLLYNYGYNPNNGTYKTMISEDLVVLGGKKYFQFGGSGINATGSTDINGNRPIPNNIANLHNYGISGVALNLKDYSKYAIVYQILVDKVGWINACSNGEVCMYNEQCAMSAFRIALVPKSEKQYVLDSWNKDVGTFKVNR